LTWNKARPAGQGLIKPRQGRGSATIIDSTTAFFDLVQLLNHVSVSVSPVNVSLLASGTFLHFSIGALIGSIPDSILLLGLSSCFSVIVLDVASLFLGK
jgi:hypothetical protein